MDYVFAGVGVALTMAGYCLGRWRAREVVEDVLVYADGITDRLSEANIAVWEREATVIHLQLELAALRAKEQARVDQCRAAAAKGRPASAKGRAAAAKGRDEKLIQTIPSAIFFKMLESARSAQ